MMGEPLFVADAPSPPASFDIPLRSRLRIVPGKPDVMTIESPAPYPGPWRRFWYWALLGWKWERLGE